MSVVDEYPLTPLQQGMLFETLSAPSSGVYFWQYIFPVRDLAEARRYRDAWQRVLDHHPALRTSFPWDVAPKQQVSAGVQLPTWELDLSGAGPNAKGELLEVLAGERAQGFDVRRPPLIRLAILRLPDGVRCLLSSHHLILDGWSAAIVFDDVLRLVHEDDEIHSAELTERPRFGDYAEWTARQDKQAASRYWRDRMAGLASGTSLRDAKDPSVPIEPDLTMVSEADYTVLRRFWLTSEEDEGVKQNARRSRVTLNSYTQAAWAVALAVWTGRQSVVFGVVDSGRGADVPGIQAMVGLLINTLPCRADIQPDQPFAAFAVELQRQESETRQFPQTRLSDVHRQMSLAAGERLFDTIYSFQNYPLTGMSNQTLQVQHDDRFDSVENAGTPLTVVVTPKAPLAVYSALDARIYAPAVIDRLLDIYHAVLHRCSLEAEVTLRELIDCGRLVLRSQTD